MLHVSITLNGSLNQILIYIYITMVTCFMSASRQHDFFFLSKICIFYLGLKTYHRIKKIQYNIKRKEKKKKRKNNNKNHGFINMYVIFKSSQQWFGLVRESKQERPKGILWDCQWSARPLSGFFPTDRCWFVYKSFRAIALIASQSTFEK